MAIPAPLPPDEAMRLARLYALRALDTPPNELFNLLVEIAALVCGVPISVLSLMDSDRQWFKASTGVPGMTQVPRDVAFCAYTILDDDVLEVRDAALDLRFRDNPLVTGEPYVRFYAGVPLSMADGTRIGTLSVIDRLPRLLNPTQRVALVKLAELAVQTLEAREQSTAAMEALTIRNEQYTQMYNATPSMLHTTDASGSVVAVNDYWLKKMGYERDEVVGRYGGDFLTSNPQKSWQRNLAHVHQYRPLSKHRMPVSAQGRFGNGHPVFGDHGIRSQR